MPKAARVSLEPSCLYPCEKELGRLVLGKEREHQWPAFAIVEERHGLPPIDQLFGGRFFPDVLAYLKRRSARAVPAAVSRTQAKSWQPKLDKSGTDLATPGLHGQRRLGGRVDYYWRPSPRLTPPGCLMKAVRVHGDPKNSAELPKIAETCQRLQAELLAWTPDPVTPKSRFAPGTLGALCDAYETDTDPARRDLRYSTLQSYGRYLNLVRTTAGDQRIAGTSGRAIRGWFNGWRSDRNHRDAYGCIQILRILARYGVECAVSRDDPCFFLRETLTSMEFEQPKGRRKKLTRDLVESFIAAADGVNAPAMVTALMLQFELSLRQKDVIGEWAPGAEGGSEKIWKWGLTWDQIDENWILRKPTSKSNGRLLAEHDLTQLPGLLARLQSVPAVERVGPVITNPKTAQPYRREYFSREFRKLADAAGWPKGLWNMDSRAGAISEAFEAGADAADVMKAATHTQLSTTMGYNRGGVVQSSRVAGLRKALRNRKATDAGREL